MKAPFLFFVLSACILIQVHAQENDETPEGKLFDQAWQHFDAGDFLTAAAEFDLIMKQYPKSNLVARAHFNKALCYYNYKDFVTSEKIFTEILDARYNEKDPNGLMEPYALYKHRTCRYLADLALKRNDYVVAEKYIHLFDKKYPYRHFCGNEWSAYAMFKAVMLAKVYSGTGQIQKAMEVLLPHIFSDMLASNEGVLHEVENILETHYSKTDVGVEFEKALSTLTLKSIKKRTAWCITLYHVEIEVEGFPIGEEENGKKLSEEDQYKQIVLNNALFKRFL